MTLFFQNIKMLLSLSYSRSSSCWWVVLGVAEGYGQVMPDRRRVPSSPAKCSCNSCALQALFYLVFLEKNNFFFAWSTSLLVSLDNVQCNDCSTTAWLRTGVSPSVKWSCWENAEPQPEKRLAAVARKKSVAKEKENMEWKGASQGCSAHLRDVTCSAKEAGSVSSSSRQMLLWTDVYQIRCVSMSHPWDCSFQRKVLQKSVVQHMLVQEAGQPSFCFITRQDQCIRHLVQTTSFSLFVKSLKMVVSSILTSAAVPDHNFMVKTIPVLSLVLPLGFVFSQSGMTSAFKQHSLRAAFFSWQIFRIWKMSMTGEVKRGKNPFHLKFYIFQKAPAQAVTINTLPNCRSLTGCRRYDYIEFNDH